MIGYVNIEDVFIGESGAKDFSEISIIDVRSPAEFIKGHIPGAINIPLFNDEERAKVGTMYTKSGREASVLLGLKLVGPKLADYIRIARTNKSKKKIYIHCWRGGMRSASIAWLLDIAGMDVTVIVDGYKSYRRFIRKQFECQQKLVLLGGLTGSGKTDILHALKRMGEQVIDLEGIANHKGSAFGALGMKEQPTNEQFENNLYEFWRFLDRSIPVWLEDESRSIGRISIPDPLYKQMSSSPLMLINLDKKKRIQRLVSEYSKYDIVDQTGSVEKIRRKLGGDMANKAIIALDNNDFNKFTDIILTYYDKAYNSGISKRYKSTINNIALSEDNPERNAEIVRTYSKKLIL